MKYCIFFLIPVFVSVILRYNMFSILLSLMANFCGLFCCNLSCMDQLPFSLVEYMRPYNRVFGKRKPVFN